MDDEWIDDEDEYLDHYASSTSVGIKSANFNINQQPHGGQSVTQPAPNCLTATSPC